MAARVAALALTVSAVLLAGSWQLQTTADADLSEAKRLQAQGEEAAGGEPPKVSDNRKIVDVLKESIDIRRAIETDLLAIERAVQSLQARQLAAARTTGLARDELMAVGDALAASVAAAGESRRGLRRLTAGLRESARLAALIAEELEELDRKMGPSAGGPR